MDAAWPNVDFLDTKQDESEKTGSRARRAQAGRKGGRGKRRPGRPGLLQRAAFADSSQSVVEDAYRLSWVEPYAPFPEVKAAYKKLLFKYHPDRNASTSDALKKATETSTRINAAFQIIEAYEEAKNTK